MEKMLNGMTYSYFMEGKGDPLILFHGLSGSTNIWAPFRKPLAEHFTVIAFDLSGHGETESPESFCKIGKKMVEKLPKGEIFTIFDAGHAVHVEKRDKFGKIVLEILLH